MGDERKYFTYIWKIKDFSFCLKKEFCYPSPHFVVPYMYSDGTETTAPFFLKLRYKFGQLVVCFLELYDAICPTCDETCIEWWELDYELSFLAADGSVIYSKSFVDETFTSLDPNTVKEKGSVLTVAWDELFESKKHLYLPEDTLTIRCRIWKFHEYQIQNQFSESISCSVETRISTAARTIYGEIENFLSLEPNSKNVVTLKSQNKKFISAMNLCIGDNDKLHFEIQPITFDPLAIYKCRVYLVNFFKDTVKFSDVKICDSQPLCIPLSISRRNLIRNKEIMIPYNKLSLKCEILFTAHNNLCLVDGMAYEYDCQDIQSEITKVVNMNFSSKERPAEGLTTLKDDLVSLFSEGTLCDMKLETATVTFPAHSVVLSARSPVFKSMLTTDVKEKTKNCVKIEDLDANTVRQMLLFMYSDTVENLDYEKAKSLYFAADKYKIVPLKVKCSNFLKENLRHSNCCDVLLLADKHQDKNLKKCVQDFIAENDDAIFFSNEWIHLEEKFSRLATEVFRAVYMMNRSCEEHN